jgi:hypothetical protein
MFNFNIKVKMEPDKTIGAVSWLDLTIDNAESIRDFL